MVELKKLYYGGIEVQAAYLGHLRLIGRTPVLGAVFDGDSITAGYGVSTPFPSNFAARTGLAVNNLGNSGVTLVQLDNTFVSRNVGGLYNPATKNYLMVFAGINDILFTSGITLATVQNALVSYCAKARAAGFKVYTATALKSATITSPQETMRQNYNAWMRTNWSSFCDGLVDIAAIPELSGTPSVGTWWVDGDHPTNAGHELIASLLIEVFQAEEETPVIVPARWVQTDTPATGLTISPNGLTITATADARHVTSDKGATGKVFISHIWGSGPNYVAPGISNGVPIANFCGDSSNSIGCYDGVLCYNGSWNWYYATGEHVAGDVVDMAYDRATNLVWARKNGGNWNNNGAADPATGVGGYNLPIAGTGPIYGAMHLDTGQTMTANFGSQPYAYPVPAGFLGIDRP